MSALLINILICIAFSIFFSGMEIAFMSSNKLRFEMEKDNSLATRILAGFYRHPKHFSATMSVGSYIALVLSCLLLMRFIELYLFPTLRNQFLFVLVEILVCAIIMLVSMEFVPKTIFKTFSRNTLRFFAVPAYICHILLYPATWLVSVIYAVALRLSGNAANKDAEAPVFTKVDLDTLIQSSLDEAENPENINTEVELFRNALDFSNIKVRDCMIPRTEIIAVELDTPLEKLKEEFIEHGISKIIVYKESIDNIVGYIHSSEMFKPLTDWHKNIRRIPIVPESMGTHKLMTLFMQQKRSLAVVVDEFGGTSGIVAMEDLVEEILGDIEDEHDTNSTIAKSIGENEYIFAGRLEIEKANEDFGLDLPESDEYQSFPKAHETVTIGRFQFKIIKVTATKIELVKLKVTP